MRKIIISCLILLFCFSISNAQDEVGEIVRSKDSVFINQKYFDKEKSSKIIEIGDEIKICCGGSLIVHFNKNASIKEIVKTPTLLKFKISKPDPSIKETIQRYSAYTTLSSASRGGIFEPPQFPPDGSTAFLEEELTLQWNKQGKMFYLLDSKKMIIFMKELYNATEFTFTPSMKMKINEGKYFWKIDDSDNIEINFVK
ncbi:MAG: hypothetical protein A2X64_01045 [Ignavibacteria bacterium GWF2_33_9]|nr:MAG: hypothetical protein A2X64_01045 [Ignavibacteria bacterium GWF2_33_9]